MVQLCFKIHLDDAKGAARVNVPFNPKVTFCPLMNHIVLILGICMSFTRINYSFTSPPHKPYVFFDCKNSTTDGAARSLASM